MLGLRLRERARAVQSVKSGGSVFHFHHSTAYVVSVLRGYKRATTSRQLSLELMVGSLAQKSIWCAAGGMVKAIGISIAGEIIELFRQCWNRCRDLD